MALIQGTNAGEIVTSSSRAAVGSFFKGDVETQIITAPKAGHSLDVIILPSFDLSKGPSEFNSSYIPYRETNSDLTDPITNTPAFTGWAKSCKAYTYFGNTRQNFVSPLTGKAYRAVKSKKDNKVRYYPPSSVDPVVDITNYIFFHQDEVDPATRRLLDRNERGMQILPRGPKSYIISNALVSVDQGPWQFKVIAYSETAYTDLVKMLAWRTAKSQNGLTPMFDDFLFGDITDPFTGSILSVSLKSTGIGPDFAGFNISDNNMDLNGRRAIPEGLITKSILEQRVVLNDTDYLDVWSYQRIVDFLVEDGQIPINVIKAGTKPGTIVEPKAEFEPESRPQVQQQASTLVTPASASTMIEHNIPVSAPEPVANIESDKDLSKDPELAKYLAIAKTVMEGQATPEDVQVFLTLQSKFGPASQYQL